MLAPGLRARVAPVLIENKKYVRTELKQRGAFVFPPVAMLDPGTHLSSDQIRVAGSRGESNG